MEYKIWFYVNFNKMIQVKSFLIIYMYNIYLWSILERIKNFIMEDLVRLSTGKLNWIERLGYGWYLSMVIVSSRKFSIV